MTFKSMIEAMLCMDDLQCKEFIVRTKSGAEYTGTPFDANDFYEYDKCPELFRGDLTLYRGIDLLFIDIESIESIRLIKQIPEEIQAENEAE